MIEEFKNMASTGNYPNELLRRAVSLSSPKKTSLFKSLTSYIGNSLSSIFENYLFT